MYVVEFQNRTGGVMTTNHADLDSAQIEYDDKCLEYDYVALWAPREEDELLTRRIQAYHAPRKDKLQHLADLERRAREVEVDLEFCIHEGTAACMREELAYIQNEISSLHQPGTLRSAPLDTSRNRKGLRWKPDNSTCNSGNGAGRTRPLACRTRLQRSHSRGILRQATDPALQRRTWFNGATAGIVCIACATPTWARAMPASRASALWLTRTSLNSGGFRAAPVDTSNNERIQP